MPGPNLRAISTGDARSLQEHLEEAKCKRAQCSISLSTLNLGRGRPLRHFCWALLHLELLPVKELVVNVSRGSYLESAENK